MIVHLFLYSEEEEVSKKREVNKPSLRAADPCLFINICLISICSALRRSSSICCLLDWALTLLGFVLLGTTAAAAGGAVPPLTLPLFMIRSSIASGSKVVVA